ncbi:tripartite tricarboxylate transporter substrate binding protein [Roseococcus sp. SYP-B2431]|uniref:Bug family tripartite tricarboxylate transporter substrate binding protein n=1 Tax=Roseococcus sp. SYP-B2431 TaxID=2496640 RepID=UPI00103C137A|nr:tripartite tricarboxylate transporter substrate binding protein [Roseococcus sp. SYP-B2431]TCH99102.1 tripartite tricarboxylate transporter substrate binding protein [Roseococcus sp. SYP-B2431]
MNRRSIMRLALGAASAPLAAPALRAQAFDHTIRFIIPNAPGGTSDILARLMAPELTRTLGQNVVVENRAGAGGNIGADLVAKSPPDGHTIVLMDVTTIATNPALFPRLSYKPSDLAPVSMVIYAPYILGVANNLPIRNAAELVAYAKANPNRLNAANSGTGTASHLTAVMLADAWGSPMEHVPYRGGAPALLAVSTGEASLTLAGATQSLPFATNGQMRPVAVTGPARFASLPQVPTFGELGWPGTDAGTWQGMLVAAGAPAARIDRLHTAVRDALATPMIATRIAELGATPRADGPEPFASWLAQQTAAYTRLIQSHNIRAE